jgi:hypothetical protein
MFHGIKRVAVTVPLQDVEAIDGPVGELSVPKSLVDQGFEACSLWVTSRLIYLSNEIGRRGVAVTSSHTEDRPNDPEISQIIRLYGVRIQDYVLVQEKQYDETPN